MILLLDESGQAIQVYIALHQQSFSTNTRANYSEEEENYDFFAWPIQTTEKSLLNLKGRFEGVLVLLAILYIGHYTCLYLRFRY